ncbi:MAG: YitT family protein, partial [Clostridia bacterium]|nr:YitT family protein [Clostridia bacterium]
VLGKNFALQTLVSAIVYPPAISILTKFTDPAFLGGILYLKGTTHPDIAVMVAAIFGGALVGTGCSLTFLGGGSTGGMDIIAFTICKIFKRSKSSVVIFILDATVIVFGLLVIKDLVVTLLGIISAFVSALVIDKIFVGGSKALIAQIVSNESKEINRQIIEKLKRTTSFIDVTGGYSGEPKKMLMVSFTMRQYNDLKNIINQTDKNAFVTVHRAHEINGQGWTR